jgi:hypothetical protein
VKSSGKERNLVSLEELNRNSEIISSTTKSETTSAFRPSILKTRMPLLIASVTRSFLEADFLKILAWKLPAYRHVFVLLGCSHSTTWPYRDRTKNTG